jgi:hypothetical protein
MVHDGFVFPGHRSAFDMMRLGWDVSQMQLVVRQRGSDPRHLKPSGDL